MVNEVSWLVRCSANLHHAISTTSLFFYEQLNTGFNKVRGDGEADQRSHQSRAEHFLLSSLKRAALGVVGIGLMLNFRDN